MAKLSAHGTELYRYFHAGKGVLVANFSDGVTMYRSPLTSGWKILGRKKPDATMAQWLEAKRTIFEKQPAWAREVKSIPSLNTLEEWENDCTCESVSGDTVEPDGHGPDGAPSWLLALKMI